jgi:hypothetical protein
MAREEWCSQCTVVMNVRLGKAQGKQPTRKCAKRYLGALPDRLT